MPRNKVLLTLFFFWFSFLSMVDLSFFTCITHLVKENVSFCHAEQSNKLFDTSYPLRSNLFEHILSGESALYVRTKWWDAIKVDYIYV